VCVDAARRDDLAFAGNNLCSRADDDVYARLHVGIAGLADRMDEPVSDGDVRFDDSPVIQNQCIRDHGIDGALVARALRLPHSVTDDLAAAELHFFAVNREVAFDFDDQLAVRETHAVADRWAEHLGVRGATHRDWHGEYLLLAQQRLTVSATAEAHP